MRAAGVPEELIQRQCTKSRPPTEFPLWPENATAGRVWLAVAGTQWTHVDGFAGSRVTGLRYEALPAVMDLLQVPLEQRGDVLAALRVMERAVLNALRPRKGTR